MTRNTWSEALDRESGTNRQQIEELVESRCAGATTQELAERFGIQRTTVMTHIRRHVLT